VFHGIFSSDGQHTISGTAGARSEVAEGLCQSYRLQHLVVNDPIVGSTTPRYEDYATMVLA